MLLAALRHSPAAAARFREWYRAGRGVSHARFALAAAVVPGVPLLVLVPAGVCPALPVVLATYLGLATVTDLLWRRVPNRLTVAALAWVVAGHAAAAAGADRVGLPPLAVSLEGAAACFGLMFAFYLPFRCGAGDVKLQFVSGAMLGWWHGLEAIAFGYAGAGVVALALLVGRRLGVPHPAFRAQRVPMVPFFALGVLLTLRLPGTAG